MMVSEELIEVLDRLDPMDEATIDRVDESLMSLMSHEKLDDVETIIKKLSNRGLLSSLFLSEHFTVDFMKRFIDYDFKFNKDWTGVVLDDDKLTYLAFMSGNIEMLKYFVEEKKFNINLEKAGKLIKDCSIEGMSECKKYLLESGLIDINSMDGELLIYAIDSANYSEDEEDVAFVNYLLEKDFDLSICDYKAIDLLLESHIMVDTVKKFMRKLYLESKGNDVK